MALPFYDPRKKTWAAKIGYTHTKSGKRDRAWFYFEGQSGERPPDTVIADAVNKQREWAKIKGGWDQVRPMLAEMEPDKDWSLPVWYTPETYAWDVDAGPDLADAADALAAEDARQQVAELKQVVTKGNLDTVLAELRAAGILPKGIIGPSRTVTIREAITEYLAAQRKRIELKIGDRIDVSTYNTARKNLLLCLGQTIAPEYTETVKLLDLDKPLNALGHADLLAIAHYWFTLPGNVGSRRTVKNYFSGLRAFLNWCESQDAYGFTKPKESAKILSVKGADEPNVTPADYVSLAAVMKGAPVRTRMYAMLGVLCGFGQMDICKLGFSEVQVIDGETFITGYRAKEDSEAKRGKKIKTTHWIPASVAAVMQAERAEPNEWGYYFLNRSGRPMFAEKIDGGKYDAVTKAWEGATADHDNAPTFKQLRKWGWNEIPKHADLSVDKVCVGEMLAKRWAGQQGGGVAAAYRFSDYRPVIAAQRAWWAEIEAKVWQEREASRKE